MLTLTALALLTRVAPAQMPDDPAWKPLTNAGILRASAVVDSVMVDRQLGQATIDAGDFTSYLMARLGILRIPDDLAFRVASDTMVLRIGGRLRELPAEARRALSGLVAILPPDTRLEAQITLQAAGPAAYRFHLEGATVQGIPIPDALLGSVMADVGGQYPALTRTGRDLYVQIPPGARVTLSDGSIALTGP
jgi:hypothetical protein